MTNIDELPGYHKINRALKLIKEYGFATGIALMSVGMFISFSGANQLGYFFLVCGMLLMVAAFALPEPHQEPPKIIEVKE